MSFMTFLSIAGAFKQYSDADNAAAQMREAGEKNAQLAELETKERIRRSRYQHEQEQGQRVVATGVRSQPKDASPLVHLGVWIQTAEALL